MLRTVSLVGVMLLAVAASGAVAQCFTVQAAYPGLNSAPLAFTFWTPAGAATPSLVAGGAFTEDGRGSHDFVAIWNGTAWDGLGWGTDGRVNAVATWDPDGDGPLAPQLIIAGEFTAVGSDSTGQIAANHIARWDGESWQPLGIGTDGPIDALATWDPDGDGPLPPLLIAGGRFTHAGAAWSGGVAWWNGASWGQFGWGIDGSAKALTIWDPDGSGPEIPNLVVGGVFPHAGADSAGQIDVNNIARWDGTAWRALGGGYQWGVTALTTLARGDGDVPTLIAGGIGVQSWTGGAWHSMDFEFLFSDVNDYVPGQVVSMTSWDPDGGGPGAGELMVGGFCWYNVYDSGDMFHSVYVPFSATWDEWQSWRWFDHEICIASKPLPSSDPQVQSLVLSMDSGPIEMFGATPPPHLTHQPGPQALPVGATARFSVEGGPATAYSWRKRDARGRDTWLSDGPTASGSVVSGAHTSTMTLSNLTASDTAEYFAYLSGPCGSATADGAALRVLCSEDFNHDGSPGTDQDILDFFSCLAGACCPACDGADFNGDGDVGDDADIEAFFRVLGGGSC